MMKKLASAIGVVAALGFVYAAWPGGETGSSSSKESAANFEDFDEPSSTGTATESTAEERGSEEGGAPSAKSGRNPGSPQGEQKTEADQPKTAETEVEVLGVEKIDRSGSGSDSKTQGGKTASKSNSKSTSGAKIDADALQPVPIEEQLTRSMNKLPKNLGQPTLQVDPSKLQPALEAGGSGKSGGN